MYISVVTMPLIQYLRNRKIIKFNKRQTKQSSDKNTNDVGND